MMSDKNKLNLDGQAMFVKRPVLYFLIVCQLSFKWKNRPKPTTIIDGFVTQKEDNLKNENIANNEKTSRVVRVKGDGLDGKVVQIVNIK